MKWPAHVVNIFIALSLVLGLTSIALTQRIAILAPEKNPQGERIAEKLSESVSNRLAVVDNSLGETAFRSVGVENPFNLAGEDAKRIGSAIGCDAFVLVKAETLRRTSSAKPFYYESYSAIFVVGTRTGHLIWWELRNAEADTPAAAEKMLTNLYENAAAELIQNVKNSIAKDVSLESNPGFPEILAEGSPEAKNFRPPVPYLRIKPEYTQSAFLYDIKGTVEILVDLGEKGNIERTEITRWAGFGLDESVVQAVRKMNWRPAERGGKPLPIRFLLRYNFKKIEKDQTY